MGWWLASSAERSTTVRGCQDNIELPALLPLQLTEPSVQSSCIQPSQMPFGSVLVHSSPIYVRTRNSSAYVECMPARARLNHYASNVRHNHDVCCSRLCISSFTQRAEVNIHKTIHCCLGYGNVIQDNRGHIRDRSLFKG